MLQKNLNLDNMLEKKVRAKKFNELVKATGKEPW
jgi:hypothetical protein